MSTMVAEGKGCEKEDSGVIKMGQTFKLNN